MNEYDKSKMLNKIFIKQGAYGLMNMKKKMDIYKKYKNNEYTFEELTLLELKAELLDILLKYVDNEGVDKVFNGSNKKNKESK